METQRGRRPALLAGIAVVTLLIGSGAFLIFTSGPSFPEIEAGQIESLVIMPLETNLSDFETHRIGTGFYLDLLSTMGQLHQLDVIAKRSAYHAHKLNLNATQQAELLNVDAVLRGEFVEEGDRYRIAAELVYVDRASEEEIVIWSGEFRQNWSNLLKIKQDILKNVISRLKLGLSRSEIDQYSQVEESRSSSHTDYLEALYDFEYANPQAISFNESYFERLTREVSHTEAAGQSARFIADKLAVVTDDENWDLARNLALGAAGDQLDRSASAHYVLALDAQAHSDVVRAQEEFQTALQIAPNDAEIHQKFAQLSRSIGKIHDSYQHAVIALRLDPFSPQVNAYHAQHHLAMGETAQALSYYELVQEIDPESVIGHRGAAEVHFMTWDWTGLEREYTKILEFEGNDPCVRVEASRIYLYQGKFEDAMELVAQAIRTDSNSLCANAELGYYYGIDEQYDDAIQQLDHTIALYPESREGYLYKARIHLFQTEPEAALTLIDTANANVLDQDETYQAEIEMIRGLANAQKGLRSLANSDLGRLVERLIGDHPVFGSDAAAVGLIGLLTGQFGLGFNWLTTGVARREPMAAEIMVNPLFAWLKNDARFLTLLSSMNLRL